MLVLCIDLIFLFNVLMWVEGMDCVSCVGKIEVVFVRMFDVFDICVNFMIEMFEFNLVFGLGIKVVDIERIIKSFGFGVFNICEFLFLFDVVVDVVFVLVMCN